MEPSPHPLHRTPTCRRGVGCQACRVALATDCRTVVSRPPPRMRGGGCLSPRGREAQPSVTSSSVLTVTGSRQSASRFSAHMSRHTSLGRSRQCVQSARAIVQSARAVVRAAEADKCGSIPCVAGRVWQPDAGVSVADAGREMQAGGGARACRGRSRSTKAHRERRAREARTPSPHLQHLEHLVRC